MIGSHGKLMQSASVLKDLHKRFYSKFKLCTGEGESGVDEAFKCMEEPVGGNRLGLDVLDKFEVVASGAPVASDHLMDHPTASNAAASSSLSRSKLFDSRILFRPSIVAVNRATTLPRPFKPRRTSLHSTVRRIIIWRIFLKHFLQQLREKRRLTQPLNYPTDSLRGTGPKATHLGAHSQSSPSLAPLHSPASAFDEKNIHGKRGGEKDSRYDPPSPSTHLFRPFANLSQSTALIDPLKPLLRGFIECVNQSGLLARVCELIFVL